MDKILYKSELGDAILTIIGLSALVIFPIFIISINFWWISVLAIIYIIYYLYFNPLIFTMSIDNFVCLFVTSKKQYNYSDIQSVSIVTVSKGGRALKIKFKDSSKVLIEYGSLEKCVYFLNIFKKKDIIIIKNNFMDKRITVNDDGNYTILV